MHTLYPNLQALASKLWKFLHNIFGDHEDFSFTWICIKVNYLPYIFRMTQNESLPLDQSYCKLIVVGVQTKADYPVITSEYGTVHVLVIQKRDGNMKNQSVNSFKASTIIPQPGF